MSLVLVIETSSRPYGVILGNEGNVLFDSSEDLNFRDNRDIPFLVASGLKRISKRASDIELIAVNIGPGGLSSIRAGVSFVNGLAFGLKIPVCPFTSFELMGFEAWEKCRLPILCTARATEGNAYIGLYDNKNVSIMRFGLLGNVVKEATSGLNEFAVAGAYIDEVQKLFNGIEVHDSGIKTGQAKNFIKMEYPVAERAVYFPDIVTPINEQSRELYE